jgi:Txe/YoeB family toxin of Txe-Axe toxin-antitoxin module
MIKPSKVKFISIKLQDEFNSLKENDPIKKALSRAIMGLQQNVHAGVQVPKKLIPETYIKKYQLNNLWKYNLSSEWRLIYTLTSENEIELICAVLEWFDSHKEYKKRFNYL